MFHVSDVRHRAFGNLNESDVLWSLSKTRSTHQCVCVCGQSVDCADGDDECPSNRENRENYLFIAFSYRGRILQYEKRQRTRTSRSRRRRHRIYYTISNVFLIRWTSCVCLFVFVGLCLCVHARAGSTGLHATNMYEPHSNACMAQTAESSENFWWRRTQTAQLFDKINYTQCLVCLYA